MPDQASIKFVDDWTDLVMQHTAWLLEVVRKHAIVMGEDRPLCSEVAKVVSMATKDCMVLLAKSGPQSSQLILAGILKNSGQ